MILFFYIYIYIYIYIHTVKYIHSYIYTQLYIYSVIYIYIHILFHYVLWQDIKYSSLCYTVGPCCLSILYKIVCIRQVFVLPPFHRWRAERWNTFSKVEEVVSDRLRFFRRQSDLRIHTPWLLIALRISPNTDTWNCPIYLFFLWLTQMVRSVLPRWYFLRNPSSTLADWVGYYSSIPLAPHAPCYQSTEGPVLDTFSTCVEYWSTVGTQIFIKCMNEWINKIFYSRGSEEPFKVLKQRSDLIKPVLQGQAGSKTCTQWTILISIWGWKKSLFAFWSWISWAVQVGSYLHLTTSGYRVMPETVAVTTRFLFMKVGSGKRAVICKRAWAWNSL